AVLELGLAEAGPYLVRLNPAVDRDSIAPLGGARRVVGMPARRRDDFRGQLAGVGTDLLAGDHVGRTAGKPFDVALLDRGTHAVDVDRGDSKHVRRLPTTTDNFARETAV